MRSDILMECGHSANAEKVMEDGARKPACVICNCSVIAENKPDLVGRKARCTYYGKTFTHRGRKVTCTGETDSKYSLAFFEHKPNSKHDEYYCGCWGWD